MKFRISGNIEEIKKHLEEFVNSCEKDYKASVEKTKNKTIKISKFIPVPMAIPDLPNELILNYYEENGAMILFHGVPIPKKLRTLFNRMMKKKMVKSLEGFFNSKNCKVSVEFIGD